MKSFILMLIRAYQSFSKSGATTPMLLGAYAGCRSWPTCSDFAYTAIERDGVMRGGARAFVRFIRCNPFSPQQHA